ncbi:MAG TPA: RNA polymerase sigma factor [Burkholderiales bacterium]
MPPLSPLHAERSGELLRQARAGDRAALEELIGGLADGVYRIALRMTASVPDAEDATQEILQKVADRLASFRGEASLPTWTYRIAVNHLLDRKRSQVEELALDFERFGADLLDGLAVAPDSEPVLAEEVKLGCTLAMLTCLDREHRVAYVLGEVFDLPGQAAADVAQVESATYRQRLSRARRQVEAFTESYCGLVNRDAPCACDRRVSRAKDLGRIGGDRLPLSAHPRRELEAAVREMEGLHAAAALLRSHPHYRAPEQAVALLREALLRADLALLR